MSPIQVVAFVGMAGAGKTFCVDYLIKKGFPSTYFGGITIDEVKRRGLEVNEANEKLVREELRQVEGKGVYAKRIISQIEAYTTQGHQKIVVDGLYTWSEYKIFKEHFGDQAIMIAIAAPRHLRHQRLTNRSVRPLNTQEANERDYAEIENVEKGGPIANADYTIVNDGTSEEMLQKLEKILQEIGFTT